MARQLWLLLLTIYSVGAHIVNDDPYEMHAAARLGQLNLVKHLLEGGAAINLQNPGWLYTPLHYAAYYGREDVVSYLLAAGASKTIENYEGHTALDVSYIRECEVRYDETANCKAATVNYEEIWRLLTAECVSSLNCRSDLSCVNQKCVNLCHRFCGVNADCHVGSQQPICTCKKGYSGNAKTGCQYTAVCTPNCHNGVCTGRNVCQCRQGWTGNFCQTPVCFPQCVNGECTGPNTCTCSQGWKGILCQTPVCSPNCHNGECTGQNECQCHQGWTGNLCQNQHSVTSKPKSQPVCHIPTETDTNVTILKCGTEEKSNCAINNQVPMGTKVMVSCWRSPPIIAQCNQDSSWDECDANSCQKPFTSLLHLCKQDAMNAQYCGYRPPYTSSAVSQLNKRNTVKRYPWLVGIFVNEKYICTGTLISVRYVLTAAHCTSGSQSSSNPIDMRDVKVQHIVGDQIQKRRIDKIIHHPSFKNGARPVNDISLLRLEIAVTFSASVMPSCIAEQYPAQIESAVAFDRSTEKTNYHWKVQLQKLDNRCKSSDSGDSCQQLKIENRQFCSIQLIPGLSSEVRKGASGGPFLVNMGTEEQEQQSLLGVASYRVQMNACVDTYTVYTDVTAFSLWISYCLDAPLNATKDCHGYQGF